jgi:hypothetical protein
VLVLCPALAAVVCPGGIALDVPVTGTEGTGGFVWMGNTAPAHIVIDPHAPPSDRSWLLDTAPHLVDAWCIFGLGGWAGEIEILGPMNGCMVTTTAILNRSGDGRDVFALLSKFLTEPITTEADYFIRDMRADLLCRARSLFRWPDVRRAVLTLADRLFQARRLLWREAHEILSTHIEASRGEILAPSVCVSGSSILADAISETAASGVAPTATVETVNALNNEQTTNETKGEDEKCTRMN